MTGTDAILDQCWGKADPSVEGGHHPALLHMLDVAAVALELMVLPSHQRRTAMLCRPDGQTAISPESVAFLVALHDLGKISPGFQAKVPGLAEPLRARGLPFPSTALTDHSRVSAATVIDHLEELEIDFDLAVPAALAVASHHGAVPSDEPIAPSQGGGSAWQDARRHAVTRLAELLDIEPLRAVPSATDRWAALLAGLTSVADWIGSDTDHFPYQAGAEPTPEYLASARGRAKEALRELGWSGWAPPTQAKRFDQLFSFSARPLQAAAEAAAPAAQLLILEAPTGTGKTEAALAAAEQWTAGQAGAGLYVALPTQATSNQMVGRVADFLATRFPRSRVNLHLAHGGARFERTYAELRARSVNGPGDTEAGVRADAWFASRKRPLLAPFSVGTIDQALLSVLQCRHGLVRLYGLSGKVVVIDEVHAYDAFMSRILEQLLAWLRAIDCRVVLLSATLPGTIRTQLLGAWGAPTPESDPACYPRLTAVDADGEVSTTAIDPPAPRAIGLRWGPDATDLPAAAQSLLSQVEEGGCAAWICNTVQRAQEAAVALAGLGWSQEDTTVFHARLPAAVRRQREESVLGMFGPRGRRPRRHVVVATQVIEQSLDLDFDLMLTEVAPIDLLLQRAGRLWRHDRPRPPRLDRPSLQVLRPLLSQGLPDFGPSAFVYHPHVLLRTWMALKELDHWVTPTDIAPLVRGVYGPSAEPPGPLGALWAETRADLEHQRAVKRSASSRSLVPRPGPDGELLGRLQRAMSDDLDGAGPQGDTAKTRDIDDSVRIVCLHQRDDGQSAMLPGGPLLDLTVRPSSRTVQALLDRAITVSHRRWVHRIRDALPFPEGWRKVGALRGARAAAFDANGVLEVGPERLVLDPQLGLSFGPLPAPTHTQDA